MPEVFDLQRADSFQSAMPAQQSAFFCRGDSESGGGQGIRQRIMAGDAVFVRPELHPAGARGGEKTGLAGDKHIGPKHGWTLRRAREHHRGRGGGYIGQQPVIHRIGFLEESEVHHDALGPSLVQSEEQLRENAAGERPAHPLRAQGGHRMFVHQHDGRMGR